MNIHELKEKYRSGDISKADFINKSFDIHSKLFDYVDVVGNTDVKEICISQEGVSFLMRDEQIRLHCPEGEARVAPVEVMNFGRYEPQETRIMDLLSEDSRCILDVGANIGWFSIRFAKKLPSARVYSFEPLPISHAYLQRNIAENNVGSRVTSFSFGLSDSSGPVEFFISPANGTNASLKNVAEVSDAQPVVGLTLTMDQWVISHGARPDFVKCDVEGAELLVFRGGRNTLETHKPVVFAEMLRKWAKPFGYQPTDMIDFFDELGYSCFAVGDEGVRRITEVTDDTVETNYAFLHRQKHGNLICALESL